MNKMLKNFFISIWQEPSHMKLAAHLIWALILALLFAAAWVLLNRKLAVAWIELDAPLQHLTFTELEAGIRSTSSLHGSLLTLNLEESSAKLAQLPWIKTASLRKVWPNGLMLSLIEHQAQARWRSEKLKLVSRDGQVYNIARLLPELAKLPVFIGPDEGSALLISERASAWQSILAPLGQNIERIELTPRRSWQMTVTPSQNQLLFGRAASTDILDKRLELLARAWPDLPSGHWKFDLRYPNGFAMQPQ